MDWVRYEVHTNTKDADHIGEILMECGIPGYETKDHVPISAEDERAMYTDIPLDTGEDDGSSVLVFYTEAPGNGEKEFFSTGSSIRDEEGEEMPVLPPEEWIRKIFSVLRERQKALGISLPEITYTVENDSLWKDKWKENFKPFRIAEDMIIKPSWEEIPADAGEEDKIIEIDPGSAFGSGTHETTKLCLLSMRKYLNEDTLLFDAGCGSGILAIAALSLGAKRAFCIDIDEAAVSGTLENAERNRIGRDRLKAIRANILEDDKRLLLECPEKFHMIVANILADVIIPLASRVKTFLREDGYFISSGILTEKADDVERALLENGFQIMERNTMGEWCSFVAKK